MFEKCKKHLFIWSEILSCPVHFSYVLKEPKIGPRSSHLGLQSNSSLFCCRDGEGVEYSNLAKDNWGRANTLPLQSTKSCVLLANRAQGLFMPAVALDRGLLMCTGKKMRKMHQPPCITLFTLQIEDFLGAMPF